MVRTPNYHPPPKKLPTFNDFTTAAEKTSAIDIVRNAKPTVKGWSTFRTFTKSGSPTIGTNTVEISIEESTTKAVAVFTATYTVNQTYNVSSDWACTTQPPNTAWEIGQEALLDNANSNSNTCKNLINGINNNNANSTNDDGTKKANLAKFLYANGGYYAKDKLGVQVNIATYSYNATGGAWKTGQITFKLVFTKSPTDKTALTSGGLFYIDRYKTTGSDSHFILAGTITDINK